MTSSNDTPDGNESNPTEGGTYAVGYGHPPMHSRFKPGQSGNPRGRPKGSKNFKTDLLEVLKMPVQIGENGRKRKISSQRAGLLRLREKALAGDARALDRLLEFARNYNDEDEGSSQLVRSSSDESILANLEARFRRRLEQGGDDDAST
ncbi:MAG: DUF5681 domain-containing protein [Pseudomonadales bacterium]